MSHVSPFVKLPTAPSEPVAFRNIDALAEYGGELKAEAMEEAAAAARRMADQAEVDTGGRLDRWDAFTEIEDWCLLRAESYRSDR